MAILAAGGQGFSYDLLQRGDTAALAAPEVDFAAELRRMNLVPGRFQAQPGGGNYLSQTTDAEAGDLEAALKQSKTPAEETGEIVQAHRRHRSQLADFVRRMAEYRQSKQTDSETRNTEPVEAPATPPPFPDFEPIPGLPNEFADYFAGAIAWNNPALKDKSRAREWWERVLALPARERRYKSTWAAFMLGKLWEKEEPEKAVACFSEVRDLAKRHFVDSLGLAVASLGLEAKIELDEKHYEQAIELYLAQLGAGDETAIESLRVTAAKALEQNTAALVFLAKNPRTQRTLTAYLLSLRPSDNVSENADPQPEDQSPTHSWLEAVEKSEVRDPETAEKIALLAYQHKQWKPSRRWLERAPGSPVAGWVRAKLLVRDGKLKDAESLLNRLVASFPLVPHNPTNTAAPESFKDTLSVGGWWAAERHLLGELGLLRLSRSEYVPALDAFLKAGFWSDAAYVAERVLSVQELKAYVDGSWAEVSTSQLADETERYGTDAASPAALRGKIRYLLARRLTREIHGDQAREYYPEEWRPGFDSLADALRTGWDESLAAETRAQALFTAAFIARTNGMELLSTEIEPDWHITEGFYEGDSLSALRAGRADKILRAGDDEIRRASANHADPEARYHYRYQAAFLAWEAANLMPNHSPETAYVLWTAGSWLKDRDPMTADLFYKALVRRNRNTELGARADRSRWFPRLAANGQLLDEEQPPSSPMPAAEISTDEAADLPNEQPAVDSELENLLLSPPAEESVVQEPAEADATWSSEAFYVVRHGDSLAGIVSRLRAAGLDVGMKDVLNANPDLEPSKLKIG
ncbi:MAG TPA: hypothetical protein VHI52_19250, partial [Verrucomicrobiae bacterium]|nr:hypothetical protein [Verrucomicrobiae bacterium]